MIIKVSCAECSHEYRLSENKAGRKFRCKECGEAVSVPGQAEEDWDDFGSLADEDDLEDDSDQPYRPPRSSSRKKRRKSSQSRNTNHENVSRSIRAICVLYVVIGGMFTIASLALFSREPILSLVLLPLGSGGLVSGIAVLNRRSWGIPFCQIVSAFYLFSFPIGTILGGYFLLNIHKVRDEFE
ncbi:hypothetical protein [Thalassoglobus sp.]|uniref:hypothetical protein n=1 Tax=Thalassoglobus sp. TaxID=2795869 RepID=UPI003AA852A0